MPANPGSPQPSAADDHTGDKVSLATLSAHLNLSRAAISRVLSGAPAAQSIPAATQARILAAADQLGYRPNLLARSLRRGHTMIVGVLVPELSEGYVTTVLGGVEAVLLRAGYAFLLNSHHHSADVMQRSLRLMTDRAVDGILAIDTRFPCTGRLPVVTVSGPPALSTGANILADQASGAEMALNHLVALGHRHIAVLRGQPFTADATLRWEAIQQSARAHGIHIPAALIDQLEEDLASHEPGYLAAQRLLRRNHPFTALLAFNDISAIGAIRALREAGLRVPQDVSVVGFDDIQSAAFQNPSLTTVRQPLRQMGELAAEKLLETIAARAPASPAQHTLPPTFIARESTGPAPSQNPVP